MAARTMQRGLQRQPARRVARAAAQQARDQVADRIELERGSVARQVRGVAEALRAAAEQLDGHAQGAFAGVAQRAADATERLGDAIERKTLSEIISDVERASRERPLAVGMLAAAVGFAAARFARSSVAVEAEAGTEDRGARRGTRAQQGDRS